jgi:hypothetical protein
MSVKLTDRAIRMRVKSCVLSLEVIHKRTAGFLFGNPSMGSGELKLRPLNDKCELVQPVQVRPTWWCVQPAAISAWLQRSYTCRTACETVGCGMGRPADIGRRQVGR